MRRAIKECIVYSLFLQPLMSTDNKSLFHVPSEEAGGEFLQRVRCVPWRSGGRNHSETCLGCIVSCTTVSRCSLNCVRSTSLRRVVLKAVRVLAASYLRR